MITDREAFLLSSKRGMKLLLSQEELNIDKTIRNIKYERDLVQLQIELLKLQHWVTANKKRVIIIFEGRDSAGKGGAIRRITQFLNPRLIKTIALPKPSKEENDQWYFQRYVSHLPKHGEILFFNRSWYNRAVVEPVNGFCTEKQYQKFMDEVNSFEKMIIDDDTVLVKLYFSISKEEQLKRFTNLQSDPVKKWKYSLVDSKAQELWEQYTFYKDEMFNRTNTAYAPWKVIQANKKGFARLETIKYILKQVMG
ncbi:MAG: polyphosphate kinase 2 [Salibacteraceae bacterium]|jgi:polyphosphate kinase 2